MLWMVQKMTSCRKKLIMTHPRQVARNLTILMLRQVTNHPTTTKAFYYSISFLSPAASCNWSEFREESPPTDSKSAWKIGLKNVWSFGKFLKLYTLSNRVYYNFLWTRTVIKNASISKSISLDRLVTLIPNLLANSSCNVWIFSQHAFKVPKKLFFVFFMFTSDPFTYPDKIAIQIFLDQLIYLDSKSDLQI